jgi:hypothetical protein
MLKYRLDEEQVIAVKIQQAALDYRSGKRTLFTVESDNVSAWTRGMASFQRDNIVKNSYLIPGPPTVRESHTEAISRHVDGAALAH